MIATLADAQPVILMSIFKPLIVAVILVGWAKAVSFLDKDLAYFFLPQRVWNGIQMAAGITGFGLWLVIPYFWVGMVVALVVSGGSIVGYAIYRNEQVPPKAKWTMSWASITKRWDQMQQEQAQRRATVAILGKGGQKLEVPTGDDPRTKAHMTLEDVLNYALPRGADRVDIMADAKQGGLSVQIDGVRYPQPGLDPTVIMTLIDYLKEHAGLDLAERRRKLTGQVRVDTTETGQHVLSLTTYGSTRGLNMGIEFDPESRTWHEYDQLGLLPNQRKQLEDALDSQEHGVVLVTCPPHQGLTTSLYSLLQRHDPYTQSAITLEDNIAFEVAGFRHHQIEPASEAQELVKQLEILLRQDPNVVMISSLKEPPVAKVIAGSADETRFYVGMTQEDTFAALNVWAQMVGNTADAANSLAAIVSARLLRRLCTTCRVPYKPNLEVVRKMNVPTDRVTEFYKHSGQVIIRNESKPCPDCLGLGYRGRVGVFEVMPFDGESRTLLGQGNVDGLRAHLRQRQVLWLQEAALAKVVDGTVSISEITRVMSKDPNQAAPPQAGAPGASGTQGAQT